MRSIFTNVLNQGYCWKEGRLMNPKGKMICNFFPEVLECYKNQDTGAMSYKVLLHIEEDFKCSFIFQEAEMRKVDYEKVSNKCIYGLEVPMSEINRILRYFVQKQINHLPNEKILVSHIGWNELPGQNMIYCAGEKKMGNCNLTGIVVDEDIQSRFVLEDIQTESKKEVFEACRKFFAMQCPIVTVLILTSVMSCLRSLFVKAELVPHFVVYIYGMTGTFKTTLAKYFCRFYGTRNDLGGLFGELESTNSALEEMICQARDVCVVIDDIAPCQKGMNTKDKKERAASLIRKATIGTASSKCQGGKVRKINYDGTLIFTAEELLDTVSTINRTILLCTDQYKIDNEILLTMEEYPDFSVSLQKCVILWAIGRAQEIVSFIAEEYQKGRSDYERSSDCKSMNRVLESFDILHIAWKLLMECGKYYGFKELENADRKVRKAVTQVIVSEQAVIRKMELSQKQDNCSKLLFEVIKSKKIKIAANKEEFYNYGIYDLPREVIGLVHKRNLYLLDQKLLDYIWEEHKIPITKNEFRRELEEEGLLVKDKSHARTKKLFGRNFLVIDYECLRGLYEQ